MMGDSIAIVAELTEAGVAPTTFELLGLAREIRRFRRLPITVLVVGEAVEGPAREIADTTGERVIAYENPCLTTYHPEIIMDVLTDELRRINPHFTLISQSTQGMDFGPRLAARLQAGCISGVSAVSEEEGDICLSRFAYNGKIVLEVSPLVRTTILLVQPGAFKPPVPADVTPGRIEIRPSSDKPRRTRYLGMKQVKRGDAGLAEADVIVAAGRGIGKVETLALIRDLAKLFPKSAVAGSRPVCDAGWLAYERQVGFTGTVVSPRLYLACGISGAYHHRVGMQGSRFIVAISTDPMAPIFNIADVCICEDLNDFIPLFIAECKGRKS